MENGSIFDMNDVHRKLLEEKLFYYGGEEHYTLHANSLLNYKEDLNLKICCTCYYFEPDLVECTFGQPRDVSPTGVCKAFKQ